MQREEWTRFGHNAQLGLGFLHAHYVQHAYPRHSHDYYVISLIERGRQSFTHRGSKFVTTSGGVILINPGAVHTGEAVDERGFEMRSLYPATSNIEEAAGELTAHHQGLPFFKDVQIYDRWATKSILACHKSMFDGSSSLETESNYLWFMTQLIKRYADASFTEPKIGREKKAIEKACRYIEENFANGVSLSELAQQVAFSPYYFLRVFHAETGMPPYQYLENVRVRRAQQLIERGKPLVDVAIEAGFSSQGHMTTHFKRIIGVTPGQYAHEVTL